MSVLDWWDMAYISMCKHPSMLRNANIRPSHLGCNLPHAVHYCILHILFAHDVLSAHSLLQSKVMWKSIYIYRICPPFTMGLLPVPGMTTTAGKYVKIFSHVGDCENSRFWHSSFCRLGNFHIGNNLQVNSPESWYISYI